MKQGLEFKKTGMSIAQAEGDVGEQSAWEVEAAKKNWNVSLYFSQESLSFPLLLDIQRQVHSDTRVRRKGGPGEWGVGGEDRRDRRQQYLQIWETG